MKRKIIKQANQAYTLTLPIDWIRTNNLSQNTELEVIPSGKSLIIRSNEPLIGKTAKIKLHNPTDKEVYLHVLAAYANGIDELEIETSTDISSTITRWLGSVLGYALVSHEKDKFTIKDINPGNYPNLDEIFKRVFQMILLFYEAAIEDIFKKSNETTEGLKARDSEVNKFCLYLQRAINKSSYENDIQGRLVFTYSFALEKIGDEIERLWRVALKHKVKKTPEIKKILDLSKEGLGKAFDLYYQFNTKKLAEIYDLREKVREKSQKLPNLDSATLRLVRHAVKIIEDASDLNHLALMKNVN